MASSLFAGSPLGSTYRTRLSVPPLVPRAHGLSTRSSGSLLQEKPAFSEKTKCVETFLIRSYEVGTNRRASIDTLACLLQEAACNHALKVGFSADGFGTTLSMRKHGLIWVMTRIHIEVFEYPLWNDNIEIETWFQFEGRIGTRRDWTVTNRATGKVMAKATSTWALMNQGTRRLSRINEDVRDEFSLYVMDPPRSVFFDLACKTPVPRLDHYKHVKEDLKPRTCDLDMNNHVSNVSYIRWVLESLPSEIPSSRQLSSLTLEFRCECKQSDTITTSSSTEHSTNLFSEASFVHLIQLSGSGKEVSRCRTTWYKNDS